MLRLLLVSTHLKILIMALFNTEEEFKSLNIQNSLKSNLSPKKDVILCNHCKRTASNGIRCLGMCVADNDY